MRERKTIKQDDVRKVALHIVNTTVRCMTTCNSHGDIKGRESHRFNGLHELSGLKSLLIHAFKIHLEDNKTYAFVDREWKKLLRLKISG